MNLKQWLSWFWYQVEIFSKLKVPIKTGHCHGSCIRLCVMYLYLILSMYYYELTSTLVVFSTLLLRATVPSMVHIFLQDLRVFTPDISVMRHLV